MGQNASKTYCFLGCSNLKKMCKVTIFISIHQLSGWHHLEFRPYMVQRRGNGKDFEVKKFCPLPLMTFFNQNVCVFYFILKELLATLWSADKSEEQEGEGGPPESYRRCPTSSQYRVSTIIWFQTIFFRFGIFRTKLARVLKVPSAFVVHWFPVGISNTSRAVENVEFTWTGGGIGQDNCMKWIKRQKRIFFLCLKREMSSHHRRWTRKAGIIPFNCLVYCDLTGGRSHRCPPEATSDTDGTVITATVQPHEDTWHTLVQRADYSKLLWAPPKAPGHCWNSGKKTKPSFEVHLSRISPENNF